MRFLASIPFFACYIIILFSCGNAGKVNIKGDPKAIQMAQNMIDSLGGKDGWAKIKSVYIRSVNSSTQQDGNYMTEEWIDLDQPKILRRQVIEKLSVTRILNGNNGWTIKNNSIELMPDEAITEMLDWYDHFLMKAVLAIAAGGENIEVKKNGNNRFDLYIGNKFMGGFELNEHHMPIRYFNSPSTDLANSVMIIKWGEYKGLKYPLELHGQASLIIFRTDYWDPREINAEEAFNISFDPNVVLEKMN